jgi:7-cyano-7-deazaguanine synthase
MRVGAVSFTYGQKHTAEIEHAIQVASHYDVAFHRIIDLPKIFGGGEAGGSVLIKDNDLDMPEASYEDIADSEVAVSPTYVPYRNGNLLSMATTVAMVEEMDEVWAGMHAEDAHNWAYPDCTPEFLGAMANAIYVGSYHNIRLVTPHMWRTKSDVVEAGAALDVPFELTMSCYEGTVPACGTCPTCVGRINAFRDANLADPIPYDIDIDWIPSAIDIIRLQTFVQGLIDIDRAFVDRGSNVQWNEDVEGDGRLWIAENSSQTWPGTPTQFAIDLFKDFNG